ncbi:MAG: CotS family spore coat protein [Lachnospiraceae bacterium]|nr:CotS family spore coat protein [Lachnospiraceae bacterium]
MNEKAVQILEQYDLTVLRTYTGRGAVMLETEEGTKTVKEFAGSRMILPYEQQLMQYLQRIGLCITDCIVPNREGELLSRDTDGIFYIVKDWPEGKACETKNREELIRAMELLAGFHQAARGLWKITPEERHPRMYGTSVTEEYEKHNRELKKVRNFIRGRQKKGDFELLFLKEATYFLDMSQKAAEQLAESAYKKLYNKACEEGHICHGEYVHHNILYSRTQSSLINFQRCCIDIQIHDLYLFLRKIMEKHNWNRDLGTRMLEAYEQKLPLSGEEQAYLALRLYYPEKIWKLANHYFHTNKAWIPEKSSEKLTIFLEQEENRIRFLKDIFQTPKIPKNS